jgi:general secretion pathway protein L
LCGQSVYLRHSRSLSDMASAGENTSQWSLFGLDLERYVRGIVLGAQQLLWGSESGLQRLFMPSSLLLGDVEHLHEQDAANFGLSFSAEEAVDGVSVLLPSDSVLTKLIDLPAVAEPDLKAIVQLEAEANSPFSMDETAHGWRILHRDASRLTLLLAISSRRAIDTHVSQTQGDYRYKFGAPEVWAQHEGRLVQFTGFGEERRRKTYVAKLSLSAAKMGLLSLAVALIVWWPALALSIKERQLQELLAETESRAGTATAARNSLIDMEDRLTAASEFYADRLLYDRWLDHVAALTPDTAYFTSMSFDKDRLTISGQAANAAELQTSLANAEILSEVTAPSAFTRDRRTNRERFTLTMRLVMVEQ